MACILWCSLVSTVQADRKTELLGLLRAPTADERIEAAEELAPLVDEKDLRRLLHGWEEKGGGVVEKHEPDLLSLVTLLSVWPSAADKIIEDLYKITDKHYAPVVADILWCRRKLQYMEGVGIVADQVKDDWFADWYKRAPHSLIWRDIHIMLGGREWLWQRWHQIGYIDNVTAAAIMAGRALDERLQTNLDTTPWLQYFRTCWVTGKYSLPVKFTDIDTLAEVTWTEIGPTALADIIAILCDKPDWVTKHAVELYEHGRISITWGPQWPRPFWDSSQNLWVARAVTCQNGDQEKTRDKLTQYFEGQASDEHDISRVAILHFPWFWNLRLLPDFEEWWGNYNFSDPVVDADPCFLHATMKDP